MAKANALQNALEKIAPFRDQRIYSVFLLGILSGLPWVMIGSALTLWLKEAGISRTDIGYAGFIFSVYAINFLWAPLLDRYQSHRFKRLGARRTWVAGCQAVIIGMCVVISQFSPTDGAKTLVLLALLIAIASATQDIAIDAFRVDSFSGDEPDKVSAAAAAATAGWWTGYAGIGALPLFLSDHGFLWQWLFPLMGAMSATACAGLWLGPPPAARADTARSARAAVYVNLVRGWSTAKKLYHSLLLVSPIVLVIWAIAGSAGMPQALVAAPLYVPALVALAVTLVIAALASIGRSRQAAEPLTTNPSALDWLPAALLTNVIAPLAEFFNRSGLRFGLLILGFVVIFKLGEAFLGRMSVVFYKEIGFSNSDIATYSKMLTWWITVAAAIPCGLLNARLGIIKGLFISGICMAASNLLFVVIALVGPDLNWYFIAVVVDGFTTAWGSVAFVAFISLLCNHAFSATQYALLASLGTLGRSTFAAFSGQMVDALGGNWAGFFVITTLMVVPGLAMLWLMRQRLTRAVTTQ